MKSRTLLAPVVALGAAALLAGCAMGGGQPTGSQVVLDPDAKVDGEITIWSWDVAATALERLAPEFEAEHPGTKINVVDVGYDNAYDKLSVGLQAGSGLPDVVTVETDRAPGYINEFPTGLVDLTPAFGDDEADFDPFKWQAQSDADGALKVVPWDSGTVGLFYRADYFDEAGIDPTTIETWDDLVAAGEQIKAKTGHTLMSQDVSTGGGFQMLLQQQGQGLFDENGDITVNSPEAVEALTLLQTINEKGLLKNVDGWDGRVTSAKDGDSAVTPEAVWWIGTLQGDAPELSGSYGVTELPAFEDGGVRTSNSGGSGLAIPTQAKNPQLAAAFIDFVLADADNQASMMENEGLFPSYLPALQGEYFATPQEYFDGQPVYELFAEQTANIPPITFTTDNAEASDIVANAVVAAVLNGADPQQALDDAAKQIATATGREIAE
ncbi:sugar ABC transporter substrate-binding protein [Agromyces endophyticus]|uniref:ABC transporter substrate-binding protein n=1 Tax=Agromyces sp. H17E-10 TaxID=2932244 RepID=UPI001FD4DF27|nr:sugar ABC transporter substrate-binding protein [Agromyces sp. H17E-10]UOQ89990.1 sugar ABC transporter substrate-binding protein [Agromyces sp. H17E-10]